MKAFLITFISACAITVIINTVRLAACEYPRKIEASVGTDAVATIFGLAWIFWAAIILSKMGQ